MTTALETKAQIPAVKFVGISHEGVPCREQDLDACVKFYMEVLGFERMKRPKALDDLGGGAWLWDSGRRVQFHLIASDAESPPPGAKVSPTGRHTSLFVEDIEGMCARLKALDVPYGSVNIVGSPQIFVLDPAGYTWEFQGAPKRDA